MGHYEFLSFPNHLLNHFRKYKVKQFFLQHKLQKLAFAIYVEERIVLLYTYESDLGDGWENSEIHNDPQEIRLKALRMGANIINYAFLN